MAVGDFNGDGRLDLAVANPEGGTVSILLGQGDGSFLAAPDVAVGSAPEPVAVGDFNGDGRLDLAVVNFFSHTVSILLGQGDGSFLAAPEVAVGAGSSSVAVGDFSGDGRLDLAVGHSSNIGTCHASILLGHGDGSFLAAPEVVVGTGPTDVMVGDFNGEGFLDLAVANQASDTVSILLGQGDGSFPRRTRGAGGRVTYIHSGGGLQWRWPPGCGDGESVCKHRIDLFGQGDGGFLAAPAVAVGVEPSSVAVGDFNGDGRLDLAVANSGGATESTTVSILSTHRQLRCPSTSSPASSRTSSTSVATRQNRGDHGGDPNDAHL